MPAAVPQALAPSQSPPPSPPQQRLLDARSSDNSSVLYTEKDANMATAIQVEGPDPDELSTMVGDKDVDALRALGGSAGLLTSLGVDGDVGLVPASSNAIATGSVEAAEQNLPIAKADNLAKKLASEQGDGDLAWLAEFEADRK
ncbi:hypothetical protein IWW38_003886, partial [Coemansia aciculifera]